MSGQQYLIRWNEHLVNFSELCQSLREEAEYVDCSLACEDGIVDGHRIVLAGCSPYFRSLFARSNNHHPIIFLVNTRKAIVQLLMEFIYRGQAYVPQEKLSDLLTLGTALKVKGLAKAGTSSLHNNESTINEHSWYSPESAFNYQYETATERTGLCEQTNSSTEMNLNDDITFGTLSDFNTGDNTLNSRKKLVSKVKPKKSAVLTRGDLFNNLKHKKIDGRRKLKIVLKDHMISSQIKRKRGRPKKSDIEQTFISTPTAQREDIQSSSLIERERRSSYADFPVHSGNENNSQDLVNPLDSTNASQDPETSKIFDSSESRSDSSPTFGGFKTEADVHNGDVDSLLTMNNTEDQLNNEVMRMDCVETS